MKISKGNVKCELLKLEIFNQQIYLISIQEFKKIWQEVILANAAVS